MVESLNLNLQDFSEGYWRKPPGEDWTQRFEPSFKKSLYEKPMTAERVPDIGMRSIELRDEDSFQDPRLKKWNIIPDTPPVGKKGMS